MRRDTHLYILTSFYVYSLDSQHYFFCSFKTETEELLEGCDEVKLSSVRFIYSATYAAMRPE